MADTIITNSPDKNDGGAAGWAVALVIIIVVVVGGILLYKKGVFRNSNPGDTNINVTIPNPLNPGASPSPSGGSSY